MFVAQANLRIKTLWEKYSRMNQVKFFKGCLPQISLGPILNTLSHVNKDQLFENMCISDTLPPTNNALRWTYLKKRIVHISHVNI